MLTTEKINLIIQNKIGLNAFLDIVNKNDSINTEDILTLFKEVGINPELPIMKVLEDKNLSSMPSYKKEAINFTVAIFNREMSEFASIFRDIKLPYHEITLPDSLVTPFHNYRIHDTVMSGFVNVLTQKGYYTEHGYPTVVDSFEKFAIAKEEIYELARMAKNLLDRISFIGNAVKYANRYKDLSMLRALREMPLSVQNENDMSSYNIKDSDYTLNDYMEKVQCELLESNENAQEGAESNDVPTPVKFILPRVNLNFDEALSINKELEETIVNVLLELKDNCDFSSTENIITINATEDYKQLLNLITEMYHYLSTHKTLLIEVMSELNTKYETELIPYSEKLVKEFTETYVHIQRMN